MAKINILPASVYNRIAAGEVVERPYSVVKELVENAIDAGAKNIEVEIAEGGKRLVRVTDDGCGIERDDLQAAFLPHATSKIAKAEDLEEIMTLGFRGEALASIASVAKVTIVSKTEEGAAHRIDCHGGKLGEIIECGGGKGTQVSVEDLFFNTPARQKFLKTDKSEESDVSNLMTRFMLGNPDVSFTFTADGRKVAQSFGDGAEATMVSVYGAKILKDCIPVKAEKNGIRIWGYIGNQNYFKANRSYQSTFVNGRYVTNSTLQMALYNAYAGYMMKRQYPFYVLFLTIPPEVVDVNVHPNKADVRFANNQIVYAAVYSIVSSVLDGSAKALDYVSKDVKVRSTYEGAETESGQKPKEPVFSEKKSENVSKASQAQLKDSDKALSSSTEHLRFQSQTWNDRERDKTFLRQGQPSSEGKAVEPAYRSMFTVEEARAEIERSKPKVQIDLPFPAQKNELAVFSSAVRGEAKEEDAFAENKKYLAALEEEKAKQAKIDVSACVFRGTLFQTYLIYERGDEAFLIDQHAAHERLIFDELKKKMENRAVAVQPMLIPYLLTTNVCETEFLRGQLETLRGMGFDIEEFGGGSFKVSAVPTDLQTIDLKEFFSDILSDINGLKGIRLAELLRDKLAMAACKAAVKGGMELSRQEVQALFEKMDGDMGLKCPHGRPVVVRLTKTEIEKMFKRII